MIARSLDSLQLTHSLAVLLTVELQLPKLNSTRVYTLTSNPSDKSISASATNVSPATIPWLHTHSVMICRTESFCTLTTMRWVADDGHSTTSDWRSDQKPGHVRADDSVDCRSDATTYLHACARGGGGKTIGRHV